MLLGPRVSYSKPFSLEQSKGPIEWRKPLSNCDQSGLSACCLLALEQVIFSEKKMATASKASGQEAAQGWEPSRPGPDYTQLLILPVF